MVTAPFFGSWFYALARGGTLAPQTGLCAGSSLACERLLTLIHTRPLFGVPHPAPFISAPQAFEHVSPLRPPRTQPRDILITALIGICERPSHSSLPVSLGVPTTPRMNSVRATWHGAGCSLLGCVPASFQALFPWEKPWWVLCNLWVFSTQDFQPISLMAPFLMLPST